MREGENIYTWIKFTNPADSVYVNTSISVLSPINYELSKLNVGNKDYIDRTYLIISIPDEFKSSLYDTNRK